MIVPHHGRLLKWMGRDRMVDIYKWHKAHPI